MTDSSERYDILLCCPSMKLAPKAAEAALRNLLVTKIGNPVAEAVAEEWAEVYCEAGPAAHDAFVKGGYTGELPVFHELTFRLGMKTAAAPFGVDKDLNFWIHMQGALFDACTGRFLKKIHDIILKQPTVFVRPHDGVAERREVPEDEIPKSKRRKRTTDQGMRAGTRVEEW